MPKYIHVLQSVQVGNHFGYRGLKHEADKKSLETQVNFVHQNNKLRQLYYSAVKIFKRKSESHCYPKGLEFNGNLKLIKLFGIIFYFELDNIEPSRRAVQPLLFSLNKTSG